MLIGSLYIGQKVLACDYRGFKKWQPKVANAQTGHLSYVVQVVPNIVCYHHINQLQDTYMAAKQNTAATVGASPVVGPSYNEFQEF